MSYQIRNSITLGVVLLLIALIGGYYTIFHYPDEIAETEKERKKMAKMVKYLEKIEKQYPEVNQELNEAQVKIQNIDKQLTGDVRTAEVYNYLHKAIESIGGLDINLAQGAAKSFPDYGYKVFNIRGEGPFSRVFRFFWQIERGKRMFKLNNVVLKSTEIRDKDTGKTVLLVQFSGQVWAYFAELEDLPSLEKSFKMVKTVKANNVFLPLIKRNLPPNRNKLVEVNRSRLKAVLVDKILIHDQSGNMKMLRVGDKVYLGYLTSIDTRNNRAEFTLNLGGVLEKVQLNLDLSN